MIERTLVAAFATALTGVGAFWWMIDAGWNEDSARNALLLFLVLCENIHIGNCRSETQSALKLSPLRTPFLLAGAICALLVHVVAMYVPLLQSVLRVEPVSLTTWLTLLTLALSIFVAMEIHKLTWRLRGHEH